MKKIFWCFVVLVVALTVIMFLLTPVYADDLRFSLPEGADHYTCESFLEKIRFHRMHDSFRLANVLGILILAYMPGWLYALLCGLIVMGVIRLSIQLSKSEVASPGAFLMVASIVLVWPWEENMYTVIFSLNYLWASLLMLLMLKYILKILEGCQYGLLSLLGICIVAFFTGWFHEGLVVPALFGIVAMYAVAKKKPSRKIAIVSLCLIFGLMVIFSSSFFFQRVTSFENIDTAIFKLFSLREISRLVYHNAIYTIFVVVYLAVIAQRKWREKLNVVDKGMLAFIGVGGIFALGFYVKFFTGVRVTWFNYLFCPIGLVLIANRLQILNGKLTRCFVSTICMLLVLFNLVWAVVEQWQVNRQWHNIEKAFEESDNGLVYYDVMPNKLTFSMKKSSVDMFSQAWMRDCFSQCLTDGKKSFRLLPLVFREFNEAKTSHVPSSGVIKLFGNHPVMKTGYYSGVIGVQSRPGGEFKNVSVYSVPFTAPDGSEWCYLHANYSFLGNNNMPETIVDVKERL